MRRFVSTLAFSLLITTAPVAYAQMGSPGTGEESPSAGAAGAPPPAGADAQEEAVGGAAPGAATTAQGQDAGTPGAGQGTTGTQAPAVTTTQAPAATGPTAGPAAAPPPPRPAAPATAAAPDDEAARKAAAQQQRNQAQLKRVAPELRPQVQRRMGPEQRPLELAQTMMLNEFGKIGFGAVDDFEKSGPRYIARVQTRQGEPESLVIDPTTAEIQPLGRSQGRTEGQAPRAARP